LSAISESTIRYRGAMLSRDECLRYADQCEAMSKIARHAENRIRLIEMAAKWRELAKTAPAPAKP